ncbi:Cobalt-zinc-cadmium efflux system outer membrane protein [Candidatus Methylobacter favarea]|uniref:Cobalt-zinc-cadmium efflux system outer membrane protein n=1 Tax=Candidatus Methylobacter favarea TaxID=2707345 RepID=A0A8S0WK59_9GAMM|nr:TolC family protein [Candidatus Methylobacter favarea]CAA9891738.1 Cobalt-zinc-cadmium efflux system outer membrane protein [Candidatus Methylobacter favarea]
MHLQFYLKTLVCLVLALWTLALRAEITPVAESRLALTEQQAIALFYQRNLDLIAASFNIDTALAQEIIAAAIPNPKLSFTISSLSSEMFKKENSHQPLPAVSPQIEQLIETAGKRHLRIESSELATEAVNLDLQDILRVLTNAVRRAYYNLLLAQKTAEVASNNLDRYREILRVNAVRLKVGDIAETGFTRIEVESLKAQGDLDQAQSALNRARADLLLLLGWPENSLEIFAMESWPEAKPQIAQAGQEQLVRQALERRPDLQAARLRIQQAGKMLTLAQRLVIPDVTVSGFYQRDPGNFFTNSGGIGISVPLPLFYKQEGEISKARVGLNSAELALRQIELNVQAEVMKDLSAWRSANAIVQRFEESVLKRIEALRKAQEFAYQKGAVGLLDLIDAERSYKAMMLDYYTALANRSNAWADLLMAYGEEIKL